MNRSRVRVVAAVLAITLLVHAHVAKAVSHEVFAHGAADRMWVGRFQVAQFPRGGDVEQTDLLVRAAGPGQQWKELASVSSHARGLASRDGQAVVLLGDGQWSTVWAPDGASTGQPLPAHAEIRALGDDGETLWAVGAVPGGWSAALAATRPTSTEPYVADADNPPFVPPPATAPTTLPAGPMRDVLFHQVAGVWQPVALVPATDDDQTGGEVAITVVDGRVSLANILHRGLIDATEWTVATGWTPTRRLKLPGGRAADDVKWIVTGGEARLWASDGNSPGWLFRHPTTDDPSVQLSWNGPNAPIGLPAVAVAGGYLRVVGLHDGKLYEQRYEPDGQAVGDAAVLALPVDVDGSPLQVYLNYGLLAALLISAGATLYRRSITPEIDPAWTPPPAAPLLPRIAAGLIDALPVLVTVAVVSIGTDPTRNALERLQELPAVIAIGGSVTFYLLHTTVLELLTRRSAGKWLMGLRAVSVDGKRATAVQVLLRNGLRVIDLLIFPLAIALFSPLRQRSADIAAGTMVVLDKDPAGKTNLEATSSVNTEEEHH